MKKKATKLLGRSSDAKTASKHKKKLSSNVGPTNGLTNRQTMRVIELRARDKKCVLGQYDDGE